MKMNGVDAAIDAADRDQSVGGSDWRKSGVFDLR